MAEPEGWDLESHRRCVLARSILGHRDDWSAVTDAMRALQGWGLDQIADERRQEGGVRQ